MQTIDQFVKPFPSLFDLDLQMKYIVTHYTQKLRVAIAIFIVSNVC
jgi:ABC-type transport system involved in Fe-S cluster assembly fused permease/ATPase subunit